MDSTEDVSARVLLRHILTTETPRTPITRSTSKTQSTSEIRRSARLSKKDAGGQTPQDILRRSLKHKLHESISKKSPLPVKRRTTVFRNTHESALPSELFDEGDTPRHVLMNILRTEPVKSPVIHEKAASEEPQPPSANSSITNKHHSIELSGLELSDVTIGPAASIARGLGKKRPRRSLNVTAFEKRLQDGIDVENEESIDDHSSLSLSSSTSLSLKTPFVDVHTEKRGLQRRVPNNRKITEEEFGAKLQMEGLDRIAPVEWALGENTHLEGFTLGQTKLSEPDLTIDIINSDTANYAQTDGMTSNFSIVATQDKPTVMASQLQREMRDMELEEQLEVEQSQLEREKSVHLFQTEEGSVAEPQDEECVSKSEKEGTADCQPEDAVAMSESEDAAESQTSERDDTAESEEEENRVESQTEEEGAADSQTEEGVEPSSHTEEEEDAEESQSDQQDRAGNSLSEEEGGVADSQTEDENDGEQKDEHISRRAHHSEGGLIMAVTEAEGDLADATEAGWSEGKSKAHSASDLHSGLEMGGQESNQPLTGMSDLAESLTEGLDQNDVSQTEEEPDAEKENFPPLELTEDIIDSDRLSDAAPEEAAASDTAEQEEEEEEEEWEDEEDEESNEVPLKTPAFVKEKRNFFLSDPLASPTVFKNIQASDEGLPPANKKQVRQRKTGAAKRETALPKSYLMNVFKHFAKTKVSADVYPVLQQTMDTFFDRLADDLETYAVHAKRKTIEVEDAVLLLKRQGYVNDKVPVEVLIEKYLRMDQRKLLIPIATSGNVVIPKKRR
ncbi:centromere protein T [Scomber japonicus]|uniref:centromere protein T n=1 Tax=Scomber japonicus TaxID=13676 RepID=UPI002305E2A3|nr:centromere protein T [Scomber japonicus]